jgi:hypothetical protein
VPAKETAHMRPKKRLFIIQYEAANGEKGLQCIEAQTPEALTKKMWMLLKAKVLEVEPIDAWLWDGQDLINSKNKKLLK